MLNLVKITRKPFVFTTEDDVIAEAMKIMESRMHYGQYIRAAITVADYFRLRIGGEDREVFSVMYLSSNLQLIHVEDMFKGTLSGAAVYPREIVKAALKVNASFVVLSHNHPGQITTPSEADKNITRQISAALGLIDVTIKDHIIVGCRGYFSFAEEGIPLI